jgi:lauroyl/myristoyl acyltransferase
VIRAHPTCWNWTLKRFKSRPDRELGPYPPYSLWDAEMW